MILLLADSEPSLTRTVLSGKDQEVRYIPMHSQGLGPSLESALMNDGLELAVIECRVKEETCLSLINTIKNHRLDVPVVFVVSTDADHVLLEAFRRGARDCFRTPFDLKVFQERISMLRSLRHFKRERRAPLPPVNGSDPPDMEIPSNLPRNIVRALDLLAAQLTSRQLSPASLARAAGMSRFHFSRTFRKVLGVTPMQYILRLRVERAKKLLKHHSEGMSVSQIAHAAGFYDSSNLNRHFKKLTGVTPTEFARSAARSTENETGSPATGPLVRAI